MEQDRKAENRNVPLADEAADSLVDFLMALPAGKARLRTSATEADGLEAMLARRMRATIGARLREDAA